MTTLIKPKIVTINSVNYNISRFPSMSGIDILAKLPSLLTSNVRSEIIIDILSFVETCPTEKKPQVYRLDCREMINNNVETWQNVLELVKEMVAYNNDFFPEGQVFQYLSGLVQNSKLLNILMSTEWWESFSKKISQVYTNLEPSTT